MGGYDSNLNPVFVSGVQGDNQAGLGTIKTTAGMN